MQRTQLHKSLAVLKNQCVDERWGPKAATLMHDIETLANVVSKKVKVERNLRK